MNNKKSIYDRLRALAWTLLIAFVIACFYIVFSKIDLQLNKLNHSVLRVVNTHKYQLVQREFEHIDNAIDILDKAIRSDKQELIDLVLNSDSIYTIFSSSVIWHKDVSNSYYKSKAYIGNKPHSNNPSLSVDTIRYVFASTPKLEIYRSYPEAVLLFEIDLMDLHRHFEDVIVDGKAYFELYDHEGNYLIHPDANMVGQFRNDIALEFATNKDTVLNSDFIGVPFVRSAYDVHGVFGGTKLFVYAPLSLTDVEVLYIGGFSMILSVSGVILMLVLLYFLNREHRKAQRLVVANIALQKEEALSKLENLKRKIDPHFLFNALGSLQQLIGRDAKLAQIFVGKMARLYRKFLSLDDSGLNTLKEEVSLAKEYYFLQKIRFGEALLEIDFDLLEKSFSKELPRFSLQILIENAIKHNEVSVERPLEILLSVDGSFLTVSNYITPRTRTDDSTGYGMTLIENVYNYYQIKGFSYAKVGDRYCVMLPLI